MSAHRIIVNRARCGRCLTELVSETPKESQMCPCGYLAIDGGREQCIRTCLDLPTDEGNFRDFVDLSVVTMTISRRGLVMEAFATEVPMTLTGPDARVHQAQPGDWVVFEAEGGHSAWDADAFVLAHDFVG